ncbi:hypothetical protein RhiirA5_434399 [Rhizophagus irregularis]|uniref:Uncharacterized protein n=1 Tax=Rhizophagus irregularis TaxID=588596 RepID=A0A2N0NQ47_9GLOM|nr:hypothetical protein RhiirA5_434846 [Rhizophagus irregularis]PKB96699.1 hypothetical protein RhiirA5_434399 [Rhizophagus irregularis]
MDEKKAIPSTLATAAEELNDYFKFWNMFALEIGDVLSLGTEVKLNNLVALQYTINIIRIIMTFDHYDDIQTPLLKLFNEIHRDNDTTIAIYPKRLKNQ